ncbi:NRDE family protein [Xanthomarina sp. F1114]|uniref:NRDE family protein n=1 Tax=Xanthomarina sp. F1114 TaxID=2996019 RepID=UPI00225E6555|nr:NRDE family protein [Xanthomarina sp. F1114]MCX7547968.1 NRDE family protein [Xanthomarina sp. F1114]
MCTVTLIPSGTSNFVLTTNRDEAPNRETLNPDFYMEEQVKLLYPKDKVAGGTWVGLSDKSRLVCLLNGGFTQHTRKDTYRLSRGVVVKDLLSSDCVLKSIEDYNLNDVEPFTIILVDWKKELLFFELVWDGTVKHLKNLPLEPNIWSSSSLYTESMKQSRDKWFQEFKLQQELNSKSLLEFHKTAGANNKEFGVIMDRGFVKTTSITQVVKSGEEVEMRFVNLQNNTEMTADFNSEDIKKG